MRERKLTNKIRKNLSVLWKKLPDAKTQQEKKEIYEQMSKWLKKLERNFSNDR